MELRDKIKNGMQLRDMVDEHFDYYVRYRGGIERAYALLRPTEHRPDVRVIVIVGPTGTGKTRSCWDWEPGLFCYNDEPNTYWWDGYQGESVVLIDEFRGGIAYSQLLCLLDRYKTRVPYKGGFTPFRGSLIFITSNIEPQHWYPGTDTAPLLRRLTQVIHMNPGDYPIEKPY